MRARAWLAVGGAVIAGAVIAALALRSPDRGDRGDRGDPASEPPTPVERPVAPGSGSAAADDTAAYHASQLVVDAGRERTAGRYAQARALLDQALALDPQPATLLELAGVEDQLGRCREAKRTAQRVVAASPTGALGDQARQLLARLGHCD